MSASRAAICGSTCCVAWQALFFTAMAIGYHRERVGNAVPTSWRTPLLLGSGAAFAGLVALYCSQTTVLQAAVEHLPNGFNWSVADLEDWLFAKGDVRPGRVLASARSSSAVSA